MWTSVQWTTVDVSTRVQTQLEVINVLVDPDSDFIKTNTSVKVSDPPPCCLFLVKSCTEYYMYMTCRLLHDRGVYGEERFCIM